MSNVSKKVAERVMNAYAAGVNDGSKDRASRLRSVADAETFRILTIVNAALMSQDALESAADVWNNHHAPTCDRAIQAAWDTALGVEGDQ